MIRAVILYFTLACVIIFNIASGNGSSQQLSAAIEKKSEISSPEDMLMKQWEASPVGGSEGWTLALDKNGITVYLRDVDMSPIKSFKGVTEVDATLSTMVGLIMDIEQYPSFVSLCSEARVLKQLNETEMYEDTLNEAMWPVKPRNSVVYSRWEQDPETLTVTMKSIGVPDYIPEKEGYVRTPLLISSCKLIPLKNNRIRISYEAIVDVGGWIPAWIVNFYLVNTPFDTMKAIQGMMPLDQYKGKHFEFLREP